MRIAIVGAGPAGARLARRLSENGIEVLLFDAREAWEKPCGGGVTSKALREFEFLRNGDAPKQMISSLRLITARNRELTVEPWRDFAIYSRKELSRMMRRQAVDAGAYHGGRTGGVRGLSGGAVEAGREALERYGLGQKQAVVACKIPLHRSAVPLPTCGEEKKGQPRFQLKAVGH